MKRLGFEGLRLKDILVNGGCAHRREDMPAAQRERCVISPKHRRGESIAHGVITLSVNTPSPTALSGPDNTKRTISMQVRSFFTLTTKHNE